MSMTLTIDGRPVPLTVRRSARAARMSLRVDPAADGVTLVLPVGISEAQGLRFANAQGGWIRARLGALPPRVPFQPGARIPILGTEHEVHHVPDARRGVWLDSGIINVSGLPEHLPRRIGDWLRRVARQEAVRRAQPMAETVNRRIRRLAVRDTRSRWGSCTARGDIAFSWRLILAPEPVFDYVVAHEVAHLVELNHSAAFWRVVATLVPDPEAARAWLKRHGSGLHRYG